MTLPKRLENIISRVPNSECVADIGCDHAYVSIAIVERGIAKRAIACDINEGPLKQAEKNIGIHGLTSSISVRLGDGLTPVKAHEADTVIVAGMGGELMKSIVAERLHDFDHFVLSPQSDLAMFRRFLDGEGMVISDEMMCLDSGKYYVIMNVESGCEASETDGDGDTERSCDSTHSECEYLYGWKLLDKKDEVLRAYLSKEEARLKVILEKTDKEEVRHEYELLKEAKARMEG